MGDTISEIEKCLLKRTSIREYCDKRIDNKTLDFLINLGI